MEILLKKEYELILACVDHQVEKSFISDKAKRNKLTKRFPKLKNDINTSIQIKDGKTKTLNCTEDCFITIYKGKTKLEQHLKGKHSIRIQSGTVILAKL